MTTYSSLASNASVHASAGSGKTYLLVSRVIRLLLLETSPASILAITFTRKAAAEMQARLMERLYAISTCSVQELISNLNDLELEHNASIESRARQLYEKLLHDNQSVRVTTFHAFCQDLLRRFPFEADVPPGFELIDKTANLRDEAWHALMSEAMDNKQPIHQHLQVLLKNFSPTQAHDLLEQFLFSRSDWWAFVQDKQDAVGFAVDKLAQDLKLSEQAEPLQDFFADSASLEKIKQYTALLARHPTKPNQKLLDNLALFLDVNSHASLQQRFSYLSDALYTTTHTPRKHKSSDTFAKKLGGNDKLEEFFHLHELLCDTVGGIHKQLAAQQLLEINRAWLSVGQLYLQHYQRIKNEQRLLDFSDLEWKTYQLLNHANNALWIQYKLDERIEHLLIDEFQDTNPTQWHLILPLLNELAAGVSERYRSVFLVGDAKQSIYRFRRANARLFSQASDWLENNLDARRFPLNKSWRSSPAVISFVNTLFENAQNNEFDFEPHETHKQDLYGKVTLLPLCKETTLDKEWLSELRNPLLAPRPEKENLRYLEEGRQIATTIQELIEQSTAVENNGTQRPARYSDILILFKARTHIHYFEQAFREAGIPYLGADRGTLLESLEVNDMLSLLHWLITPYDNLALAGILKSPLFAASDDDLLLLARQKENNWFDALIKLVAENNATKPLQRASQLLSQWQTLAGHIPVHDLLDRVYSEANVIQRYKAAFPEHLASRIQANLTRFIELALEMDSGRYPSLTRFTSWINELKQQRDEAPDAPNETSSDDRITLMTIHAAKGLEAPIVFVADSTYVSKDNSTNSVIVNWPADSQYPARFMLARKSDFTPDSISQQLVKESEEATREDTNLLYVAVTRAKQYLYITGSMPRRGSALGWYGRIAQQHHIEAVDQEQAIVLHEAGHVPQATGLQAPFPPQAINEQNPTGPFNLQPSYKEIAPSRSAQHYQTSATDEDAKSRGILIHLILEKLTEMPGLTIEQFSKYLQIPATEHELEQSWQEAQPLLSKEHLAHIFNKQKYLHALNEVPILYQRNNATVHGIIDRLIIDEDKVIIIDYKTHQHAGKDNLARLAEVYHEQMAFYVDGIRKLWPERKIEAYLLFTHCAELHKMPL